MGSGSSASAQKYEASEGSERFNKAAIQDLAGTLWTSAHDVRFEKCADDEGTVSKEQLDRILAGEEMRPAHGTAKYPGTM